MMDDYLFTYHTFTGMMLRFHSFPFDIFFSPFFNILRKKKPKSKPTFHLLDVKPYLMSDYDPRQKERGKKR